MEKAKHSGFEAPVYGEAFPAGSFEKGHDGFLVLTLTGAYSQAKKILDRIDYCVEYHSAYRFISQGKSSDVVENECVILKENAKAIDLVYFSTKYTESPISFYTIDNEGKITDRTSAVDMNSIEFSDNSKH